MSDKVFITTPEGISVPIDIGLVSPYRGVNPGDTIVVPSTNFRVISSTRKILTNITLIPTIDLISHDEVVSVVEIARIIGVNDEKLCTGAFAGWTNNRRWMQLDAPESMWSVWCLIEELVDFKKYFRLAPDPFAGLINIVNTLDAAKIIPALIYFSQYEFEQCFDMNNNEVQKEISRLKKAHMAFLQNDRTLINPHLYLDYFKYTPSAGEVWSCNGISVVPAPVYGSTTIAATINERFREFTFGIFELPAMIDFPWESITFAGGGATKILCVDYDKRNARSSDVDLFIFGATFEIRKATLEKAIACFKKTDAYYAIRGSVVTIYLKNINRKFQLISSNAKTRSDVLRPFDISHIKWATIITRGETSCELTYVGTASAALSMREKVAKIISKRVTKPTRAVKALLNGYSIEKSPEIIENVIDITSLIEDPKGAQLQDIIREINTYYYPRDMPDYEPDEEQKYILAMICKDAFADMVTNDAEFVLKNVTISGDFENSYESTNFKTFNPALIHNPPGRRMVKTVLRSKHGVIRLTSDFAEVIRFAQDETGIVITIKVSNEFAEFIKLIEGNVYRMIFPAGSNKKMLDELVCTLRIPKYILDSQAARGHSIIRDQRGNPLNIEEDLVSGDKIQYMFVTELLNIRDTREVHLNPVKFIKYSAANTEHVEITDTSSHNDNDNIDVSTTIEYE